MQKWLEFENWLIIQISDCKKAMSQIQTRYEYWFGRLTAFKEILKYIEK